jgi:hypothetical protein
MINFDLYQTNQKASLLGIAKLHGVHALGAYRTIQRVACPSSARECGVCFRLMPDLCLYSNVSVIEQNAQRCLGNVYLGRFVSKGDCMVLGKIVPFSPLLSSLPDKASRCSEPKALSADDDGSSRMGDDGCPNEQPGDDTTGYSEEEQDVLSEEANSASVGTAVGEIGSNKW